MLSEAEQQSSSSAALTASPAPDKISPRKNNSTWEHIAVDKTDKVSCVPQEYIEWNPSDLACAIIPSARIGNVVNTEKGKKSSSGWKGEGAYNYWGKKTGRGRGKSLPLLRAILYRFFNERQLPSVRPSVRVEGEV